MAARFSTQLLAAIVLAAGIVGLASGGSSVGATTRDSAWTALPTLSQLEGRISSSYKQNSLPATPDPKIGASQIGVEANELYGQSGCGQVGEGATDITREVPCTFGDRTATRSVLVIGDSQADMWIPTFDTWGMQEHWKVYRLMKLGCTPWTDPTNWPQCNQWRAFVDKEILKLKPSAVVATAMEATKQTTSSSLTTKEVESRILRFVSAISSAHAKVFIMQSVPWFFSQGSPDMCLASYPTDISKCNHDSPRSVLAPAMEKAVTLAAATGKVSALKVDQLFCTTKVCPVLVGDYNLYIDGWHFQEPWGRYIARAFSQIFHP